MKKTRGKKSRDTVPLKEQMFGYFTSGYFIIKGTFKIYIKQLADLQILGFLIKRMYCRYNSRRKTGSTKDKKLVLC